MKKTVLSACASVLLLGGTFIAAAQNNSSNDNQNTNKAASQASQETTQQTKTTTSNGSNKTSSDTVYGRIESYDLNKTISVSTPGNTASSKSFDLSSKDETVHVASGLKTGDWVSVREMTDNNGHKTVTIARSSEKAARAKRQ